MKKNDKKPLTRKTGKGYQSGSCVGNQQHYLSKPDPAKVCLLCGKLTASSERDVLKEVLNGKKISVCYDDLRSLGNMEHFYFPILEAKMPKRYSVEEYFNKVRKILGLTMLGDEIARNTLDFIEKIFYKNSRQKFLKLFTATPCTYTKQEIREISLFIIKRRQ
ncbi:MAG: hypothetical protein WC249_04000 [Patescibacteria group bacterium]|jgi:hypothetical protein